MVIKHPFLGIFLKDFILTPELLYFKNDEIILMDKNLNKFEQIILNPEIEKNLISKNELLASFAISKAENSTLTYSEAQSIHKLIQSNPKYNFLHQKIKKQKKLTQKDHDKLEFFNIARTFKKISSETFKLKDLNIDFVKKIHKDLTFGLDIFSKILPDFTPYRSGSWRNNNDIRVGNYSPSDYKNIKNGMEELISWIIKNPNPTNIAVFHTAVYALHPFNNGNKRVCRILEHLLLKTTGLNLKNLYSTSYYYHKEKERYYKYLLYSLERKNLNHFTNFIQEAIVLSIISVVKTSLETQRLEFLNSFDLDKQIKSVFKPLIKQKQIQFKKLFKINKRKVSRQTFVNYLGKCLEIKCIAKKSLGKKTYYSLNFTSRDEKTLKDWIGLVSKKLNYIPDFIKIA